MRYKARQAYVEAFRFGHDPEPSWFLQALEYGWAVRYPDTIVLHTTYNSVRTLHRGDWVICGYNSLPHGVAQNDFDKLYVQE